MNSVEPSFNAWQLLELRARIRMIDTQLIALLSRRLHVVSKIQSCKHMHALPLRDDSREREVLQYCCELASSMQVPEAIVQILYQALFEVARGKGETPAGV